MVACPTEFDLERYLDGTCTDDELGGIREHLAACPTCRGWIDEATDDEKVLAELRPALAGAQLAPPLDTSPASARYRIGELLGEGGMGVVHRAVQVGTDRPVALKLLKTGTFSPRLVERFELEARALARLDHAGIARIYEADALRAGEVVQPFLAMELVDGVPLTVRARELDVRGRVELVARVAEAVHHAHQKGVLHRDLKPGNVLVTADGAPKVLDFGIARLFDEGEGDGTAEPRTAAGQLLGTVPYMSPEQLAGDVERIDTRTDVYALGVMLYECLTGRLPGPERGHGLAGAARALEASEPPRLGAHDRRLRGDLEVVAATALAPRPEERYDSASAFAADLRRYLAREPIAARPPSGIARLRAFVRRHRTLVAAAAAVMAALLAGLIAARRESVRAEGEARKARVAADFLQSILEEANPHQSAGGREPTIRDVLARATAQIEDELSHEPEVEADVRLSVGRAWLGLDDVVRAREHLERALALREAVFGARAPELVEVLAAITSLEFQSADFDALERSAERAIDLAGDTRDAAPWLAVVHDQLAQTRYTQARYAEAEVSIRRALDLHRTVAGPESAGVAEALALLAQLRSAENDGEAAIEHLREAVRIARVAQGPRSPFTGRTLDLLGGMHLRRGETEEAERCIDEALSILSERLDADDATLAVTYQNLGHLARAKGEGELALEHFRESLARMERGYGETHTYTAQALMLVGQTANEVGRLAEAEAALRACLAVFDGRDDRESPVTLGALCILGMVLAKAGRADEAAPAFEESLAMARRLFPPGHAQILTVRHFYGSFLVTARRFEEAEEHLLAVLAGRATPEGAVPGGEQAIRVELARLYEMWGREARAAEYRDANSSDG